MPSAKLIRRALSCSTYPSLSKTTDAIFYNQVRTWFVTTYNFRDLIKIFYLLDLRPSTSSPFLNAPFMPPPALVNANPNAMPAMYKHLSPRQSLSKVLRSRRSVVARPGAIVSRCPNRGCIPTDATRHHCMVICSTVRHRTAILRTLETHELRV